MSHNAFPFIFQTFGRSSDRVLLAGAIVGLRRGDGSFTVTALFEFFDALRVPRPKNIHRDLETLEANQRARRLAEKRWAVTPVGKNHVQAELQRFDAAELDAYLAGTPGSILGNEKHAVIGSEFAPTKWLPAIERLLQEFPFETNVFLMTRFPDARGTAETVDPVQPLIPILRDVLRSHGLTLHIAADRQLDDDLLGNVAAHMWACQFGIGILEDRMGRGLNYNVMTEIGAMLMTGRRCALIRDISCPPLPTDIVGHIHKSVDLVNLGEISEVIHAWASRDLALGDCPNCRT